ncbi:hypothetical protein K1T71_007821 [Dendrolimus kikuchii]|uniref:Uncharacterized protein n=1 Tax=Dendrolimus kikuchii TaxID=765133 RepID=A0ACC1CYH1_9NEOP|nr:hypothetical protein K1T71_007821 [Dendrolimus kikuchii]
MDTNQKAFAELRMMFTERMEAFEGELKNATPCNSLSTLATDFLNFKSFFLKSLQSLQDQILKLSQSVDNLEMRSRRKILLLHGVPEEKQEDTAESPFLAIPLHASHAHTGTTMKEMITINHTDSVIYSTNTAIEHIFLSTTKSFIDCLVNGNAFIGV